MKTSNVAIAVVSALAGGLAVVLATTPDSSVVTAKSERLGGPTTETAFLPERFGVAGSEQIQR